MITTPQRCSILAIRKEKRDEIWRFFLFLIFLFAISFSYCVDSFSVHVTGPPARYSAKSTQLICNGIKQQAKWYTCGSTRELEKAVSFFVRETDSVAELGAQLRDVSTAISKNCNRAVMVDISRKFPGGKQDRTSAMRRSGDEQIFESRHNNTIFKEVSSIDDWRSALFFGMEEKSNTFDIFVLDVSAVVGNDLPWTSFSIVRDFLALNEALAGTPCRAVLVKSSGLNRLASSLVHGQVFMNTAPANSKQYILATVGVKEYRRTIEAVVQPGDAVLEVGCHMGTSTSLLNAKAIALGGGYCIGVDIGNRIILEAKKRYPNVYFSVGDAWNTANLLRIQKDYIKRHRDTVLRCGFDVVYIDLGGLSGNDGILEALMLLSSLQHSLEPRCMVIKSKCMRQLSSILTSFWQYQQN
mmetsp:Transcript_20897/g.31652  ORF Transcript_20897/g.31652 Transcript_20897/m.31652 type:complete len:412 (+) Transcript_20897:48-1283(+)